MRNDEDDIKDKLSLHSAFNHSAFIIFFLPLKSVPRPEVYITFTPRRLSRFRPCCYLRALHGAVNFFRQELDI